METSSIDQRQTRITVRPPQFSIAALLGAIAAIGVTFGVLNWLGMTEVVGYFVLAVIVVAAVAASGLVLALLQAYAATGAESKSRETGSGG